MKNTPFLNNAVSLHNKNSKFQVTQLFLLMKLTTKIELKNGYYKSVFIIIFPFKVFYYFYLS